MAPAKDLQDRWNNLYREILPQMAKARDPAQKTWPVFLDHCFARIILDNAVGIDKPWASVVKAPANKNMTTTQLENAISLDQKSLELRGKTKADGTKRKNVPNELDSSDKIDNNATSQDNKRARTGEISKYFLPSPQSSRAEMTPASPRQVAEKASAVATASSDALHLIESSNLTPFRKQVLTLLCQVPSGRYTTYAALSDHISRTTHKTCARAVGGVMRNNPFAPAVPCHRVLASDRRIGGFCGDWGKEGKFAGKKVGILREEGVQFDGTGKVVGEPFRDFK
ncbi:hypothetical protein H2203_002464 [Taxawa tesnikishii (nom. ined.)]|nr:hypothetical protein H2203_002464 [Dothideales sp. JES 119]